MEKKKIRFNVIDLVIIIAVLAIGAALVVRQFFGGAESIFNLDEEKPVQLELQIKVAGIQEASKDFIHVGDIVRDGEGNPVARITKLSVTPAEGYYVTETGQIKKLNVPTKIDVYVTIECTGKIDDSGIYLANGNYIAVSQPFGVYTTNIDISGSVIGVDYTEITENDYKTFETALVEDNKAVGV